MLVGEDVAYSSRIRYTCEELLMIEQDAAACFMTVFYTRECRKLEGVDIRNEERRRIKEERRNSP